jgi:NAD(P)-dependent dehydrogenase (short-subunit alcohol dehydrogenase family)
VESEILEMIKESINEFGQIDVLVNNAAIQKMCLS